ncbi:SdpA family antimicrobial peptide system protein [Corynebacterium diphtheriae]|nr:SdpA family antimicrobial peptide system protein [Corynebacterium diphtheriae]
MVLTLSVFLALVFFVLSIFFTLPGNVLAVRDGAPFRTAIVDLTPQNWAFFTKSPRDAEYVPYSIDKGSVVLKTPQTKASNLFGFSRNQRAQGVEIGYLLNKSTTWEECSDMENCIKKGQEAEPLKIESNSLNPTICGDSLLISKKVIPWEYRQFFQGEEISYEKVSHLSVQCSR